MSAAIALWDRVFEADAPDWENDGRDWPNREASRFVTASGLRFHVQVMGAGPVILLLHGTGAATHSWRGLAPLLARDFTVIAPDLPGHGFTAAPFWPRMSLSGMAGAIAGLLDALGARPVIGVGHSAGAAILAEMCLQGRIAPAGLVSINGALLPLKGVAGQLFSPLARLFALNPLVPRVFAWHASDKAVVARLLRGTGSRIDAQGAEFYARLARRSGHAGAALMMMANWELAPLAAALPRLAPRFLLIVGAADRSIPPADAREIARLVPRAKVVVLPRLGHLAHEEAPEPVAGAIAGFAREIGGLAA